MALRSEAESKLGKRFDLKAFNQAVLDEGVVPLDELRAHISDWIAAQQTESRRAAASAVTLSRRHATSRDDASEMLEPYRNCPSHTLTNNSALPLGAVPTLRWNRRGSLLASLAESLDLNTLCDHSPGNFGLEVP